MVWRVTVYSVPPLVAAVVAAVLVREGWRNRERTVAWPFIALMIALGGWSLSYAVQLGFTTAGSQLLLQNVGASLGATIPVSWLVLTTVYAGREDLLTRRRVLALAAEPAALVALLWTNRYHGLVWSSVTFDRSTAVPVVDLGLGPAYVAHLVAAYLMILAGILVLAAVVVRGSDIYRRQAALLVVGAAVPLGANVAFVLGLDPVPELDPTTFTFTLTGAVFGLALFRLDFLDLTPVARERLLEEFGGGLVVVDDDGRVIHFDGVARRVLPELERVGQDWHDLVAVDAVGDVDGRVLTADIRGRTRAYEVAVSPLEDHRGESVGWMVSLRDVTDRREYEQRLEVANRLLRHNLRNDMSKIIGLAEVVAEGTDGEAADAAERIAGVAEDVTAMSRKARRIETTLEASRAPPQSVRVDEVVRSVVEDCRAEWPAATIELAVEEGLVVAAPGRDLLATALSNVVENGVVHSDHDHPEVAVRAAQEGDEVVVEVADDGPGLPEMERSVLREGAETPLSHGSGLGLWLVNWVVAACGGEVSFEENEPRGTVVAVRFERVDERAATAATTAT